MAAITIKIIQSKEEWENFMKLYEEANFLHSWYWGEFHSSLGKEIERIGFYEKDKLKGIMLLIVESAKRGKYLTVPGGPIIDWGNKNLVKEAFSEMKRVAVDKKCVFIRIRPQLLENQKSLAIFHEFNWRKAPMHLTADLTHQLDITKSEEEMLAGMRKGTRYEIRKAQKIGIEIASTNDYKVTKDFYRLQIATASRQGFVPFGYDFFNQQFKIFLENNLALVYTASLKKKILAQAFVIFYGKEAVYHYGVSTEEGRKYPGAYLIQWEAIKEAKKRGMKKYNFWGVAPIGKNNHRFAGVSLFKRGFGGEDVFYLPAHDLVINHTKYFMNFIIELIRKKVRGLG
jgi:lipid II:glycine glycyltransferase (peptidoglycan interpeptide bridge formation enzyme)